MRSLLLFATSVALAMPCVAQSGKAAAMPVEIVNLEQHLWTTMAEGNFASVRSLFTKDFIEVDDHIQAVDALLISLKHCKLESYELRDLQVRILTPDSAMTAYHVVNNFNCGTADAPQTKSNDNNAVTVWVRQGNNKRWLAQAHAEAPASSDSTTK
jgi:Domain of unknown function (DUF4440)